MRIANLGDRTGVARLDAVDAATGATTGAVYRSRADQRWDVGAWTTLERSTVRLRAQPLRLVAFTVHVPAGAALGDHLGGIVVENAAQTPAARSAASAGGSPSACAARRSSPCRCACRARGGRELALSGLTPGGADGRQALLLGVRNAGNVLVKGRGRLVVTNADGDRVQDARFPIDTFVAHTGIQLPVRVAGAALPAGRYHAVAELRYAGHTTRREFGFSISDRQLAHVFRSDPELLAPQRPVLAYVLGGAAFALAGFTFAAAIFRRPRARRSEPDRPAMVLGGPAIATEPSGWRSCPGRARTLRWPVPRHQRHLHLTLTAPIARRHLPRHADQPRPSTRAAIT